MRARSTAQSAIETIVIILLVAIGLLVVVTYFGNDNRDVAYTATASLRQGQQQKVNYDGGFESASDNHDVTGKTSPDGAKGGGAAGSGASGSGGDAHGSGASGGFGLLGSSYGSGGLTIAPSTLSSVNKILGSIPPGDTELTPRGLVQAGALNVRSGPGTQHATVGKPLAKGELVQVLEERNGWYRVGHDQWVAGRYVMTVKQGAVNADSLNVRTGPGASYSKTGAPLRKDAEVTVLEERNGWYRIGENQWVSSRYVDLRTGGAVPVTPAETTAGGENFGAMQGKLTGKTASVYDKHVERLGNDVQLDLDDYAYAKKKFLENWEKNKERYEKVSAKTGIPAKLIAAIHWRESSGRFDTYLHQGDPLGKPAVHIPNNIPVFHEWEEAAIHALNMKKSVRDQLKMNEHTTDEAAIATYAEYYNGLGYFNKGRPSPYVYAGTDEYVSGKYVADGKYDPNAKDKQLGVLAMVRMIDEKEGTNVGGIAVTPPTSSPTSPATEDETTRKGTVTAGALNVRSGPGASHDKVGSPLTQGTAVTIYEEKSGWYRIGPDQWVSGGYVNTTGISSSTSTPDVGQRSAVFDSYAKQGQRNQRAEGRININGNIYTFRSGGGGNGNLPPGTYTVTPHLWSRKDKSSMVVDGVGYSFALSDTYDERVGAQRSLLRIHPDGGPIGTLGCIGIVGDGDTQRRFVEDMRAELDRNGGKFSLRVGG